MGMLATYLQDNFVKLCPQDWTCEQEVPVLEPRLAKLFGYAPKADVVLQRRDGSRKLWIEFEVSRADPVANHAKFATAHLFQPQLASETFISMVSSHVAKGRRNLAANTIFLMRHIGMRAFQTTLLPGLPPEEIYRINHLQRDSIGAMDLDTRQEIDRAMTVSEPLAMTDQYRVFFVGDLLEVMCNLQYWNRAVLTEEGRKLWGRRPARYLVFDPMSKLFAPSKFCAFRPIACETAEAGASVGSEHDHRVLRQLGRGGAAIRRKPRMAAPLRPSRHVGLRIGEDPVMMVHFQNWLARVGDAINVDVKTTVALSPPNWFNYSRSAPPFEGSQPVWRYAKQGE